MNNILTHVVYADGSVLPVVDLAEYAAFLAVDVGLESPTTSDPEDLARHVFALDPEVAEIIVGPDSDDPAYYVPARDDFRIGFGE